LRSEATKERSDEGRHRLQGPRGARERSERQCHCHSRGAGGVWTEERSD
jgi:hypothetical protein